MDRSSFFYSENPDLPYWSLKLLEKYEEKLWKSYFPAKIVLQRMGIKDSIRFFQYCGIPAKTINFFYDENILHKLFLKIPKENLYSLLTHREKSKMPRLSQFPREKVKALSYSRILIDIGDAYIHVREKENELLTKFVNKSAYDETGVIIDLTSFRFSNRILLFESEDNGFMSVCSIRSNPLFYCLIILFSLSVFFMLSLSGCASSQNKNNKGSNNQTLDDDDDHDSKPTTTTSTTVPNPTTSTTVPVPTTTTYSPTTTQEPTTTTYSPTTTQEPTTTYGPTTTEPPTTTQEPTTTTTTTIPPIPPEISTTVIDDSVEDTPYSVTITADQDGEWSIPTGGSCDNLGLYIESGQNTNEVTIEGFTPDEADVCLDYVVCVQIENGNGVGQAALDLYVQNVNDDPIISTTSIPSGTAGTPYSATINAIDGDLDNSCDMESLDVLLIDAPPGMTISKESDIEYTINWDNPTVGSYDFDVRVEDLDGDYDTLPVTLDVFSNNHAPVLGGAVAWDDNPPTYVGDTIKFYAVVTDQDAGSTIDCKVDKDGDGYDIAHGDFEFPLTDYGTTHEGQGTTIFNFAGTYADIKIACFDEEGASTGWFYLVDDLGGNEIVVEEIPNTHTVTLDIVDVDNNPVPNTVVDLEDNLGTLLDSATTPANGRVQFLVDDGEQLQVDINPPGSGVYNAWEDMPIADNPITANLTRPIVLLDDFTSTMAAGGYSDSLALIQAYFSVNANGGPGIWNLSASGTVDYYIGIAEAVATYGTQNNCGWGGTEPCDAAWFETLVENYLTDNGGYATIPFMANLRGFDIMGTRDYTRFDSSPTHNRGINIDFGPTNETTPPVTEDGKINRTTITLMYTGPPTLDEPDHEFQHGISGKLSHLPYVIYNLNATPLVRFTQDEANTQAQVYKADTILMNEGYQLLINFLTLDTTKK